MEMAKTCLKDGSAFGVCLIREGSEVGNPAVPAEVGTLARIAEWDMPQLGLLHVVALGERRFRILERRTQADRLARGRLELLPDQPDARVAAGCARCARLLERLIEQEPSLFAPPHHLDSSAWVSARLAEILPLPLAEKQALLELDDGAARLTRVNSLLAN